MFSARAREIQQALSARLPSVCYVAMNIRTIYHWTVFTLKKTYAVNVCDFLQDDEPLTLFYLISFQFLFYFELFRPKFKSRSTRARAYDCIFGEGLARPL